MYLLEILDVIAAARQQVPQNRYIRLKCPKFFIDYIV